MISGHFKKTMNKEEEKEEISTFLHNVDFYLFTMSVAKNLPLIKIHEPIWAHAV